MRINFSSWQPLWGPEDPAPWYPQVLGPFCPKVLHTLFLAWESPCPPPLLCSFLLHLYPPTVLPYSQYPSPQHWTGSPTRSHHPGNTLPSFPVPSPCPHL